MIRQSINEDDAKEYVEEKKGYYMGCGLPENEAEQLAYMQLNDRFIVKI